jgi:D-2-hydroxyacid dehydrogenase (NADP+)
MRPKIVVVVLTGPRDGVQLRSPAPFADAIAARSTLRDRIDLRATHATGDLTVVHDAEVIVCGHLPTDVLVVAPRLKWVSFWASGLDRRITPEIESRHLVLTNAAGIHAPNIAEHVMGCMLIFTRRFGTYADAQRQHRWVHHEEPSDELTGQTLGIVGLGAVGRALAERAGSFGMRVLATRRSEASGAEGVDEILAPHQLPRLVAAADHLAITVPYTRETHHLLDAAMLARMKPSAYLYNTARGAVVDEAALIAALRGGRLRGAGLDVFETEPLPAESPLWDLPNVIVTPHVAGFTPHYFTRAAALLADNLERYLDGRTLLNVYDPTRGY